MQLELEVLTVAAETEGVGPPLTPLADLTPNTVIHLHDQVCMVVDTGFCPADTVPLLMLDRGVVVYLTAGTKADATVRPSMTAVVRAYPAPIPNIDEIECRERIKDAIENGDGMGIEMGPYQAEAE